MKTNNPRKNQTGMGLIESLMMVLFITIGIVALAKFQHNLSFSTTNTQQQSTATLLATNQLEILRDFQTLTTQSGYNAYSAIVSSSSNATVGGTAYTITSTVTTFTNPNYKTLDVTVSWTDRSGTAQSVRLINNVIGTDPGIAGSFM